MLKPEKFDDIVKQFTGLLPDDLRQTRRDIEKNLKAALSATLARMDLVTREEFDIQSELLAKTRALLEEMEGKLSQLETQLKKGQK